MAADLHCHTKMSDGTLCIDELVDLAKKRGLSTIAVTDQDTFAGTGRAVMYGKRKGVEVIPGAEFSTTDGKTGRQVHILCYCCPHPARLAGLCKRIAEMRRHAALLMLQKVLHLYPMPVEMITRRAQGSTNIFPQHVMHALLDAGYTDELFGDLYRQLFAPKTGLAYIPVSYPETHEVIQQIHGAGGLAVMAHPGQFDSYDIFLEMSASHELDGVEVCHPLNSEEDRKGLRAMAKQYGLLMTGGSDFRGMYAEHHYPLGTYTTDDTEVCRLRSMAESA
ncbi:PHP domain-containing protein [Caproicibacterium lactatifermentans]|uniref:PHP domain-containing protein n=1 Tax=Caproicibacterium lactatifermentans TaxID=2666138 RepID=A0A859DUA1_9FIRM|nr:PHP domain-containing protein [Caproicibacterium lactatifermentans]QKN23833.1 PHP domain-containing protein [Caproicibacterium lactatifermentans]QKO31095.1 PHP domain-containing protein [Caproicibacterium lactatifermentans]